jgi:hypothetical protein
MPHTCPRPARLHFLTIRAGSLLGPLFVFGCGADGGHTLHKVGDTLTTLVTQLPAPQISAGRTIRIECLGTYDDGTRKPLSPPDVSIEITPSIATDGNDARFVNVGSYQVECKSPKVPNTMPVTLTVVAGAPASITATLDKTAIPSGGTAQVTCSAVDAQQNPISGLNMVVDSDPGDGVDIQGMTITGQGAGDYNITCSLGPTTPASIALVPASLSVIAGSPSKLVTDLSRYTVTAGTRVIVQCMALDAAGNPVPVDAQFNVTPAPNAQDSNSLTPTAMGDYQVACTMPSAGLTSDPVPLTVNAGLPAQLHITQLTPTAMMYKGGATVTVAVQIFDSYQNPTFADWSLTSSPPDATLAFGSHQATLIHDGQITLIAAVTSQTANGITVSDQTTVLCDARPPVVGFVNPVRAQQVVGTPDQTFNITGNVTDNGGSGVASLVINGNPVPFDAAGNFATTMVPSWGVNLISGVATDNVGNTRDFVQSFMIASNYRQADAANVIANRIADGVVAHLGQAILDEHGDNDIDDLSTIAVTAIENTNIASKIPDPATTYHSDCWITSGDLQLHVDNITFNQPAIDMWAINGGVHVHAVIPNLYVAVHTSGDVCGIGIGISGEATADSVVLDADLDVNGAGGTINVSMPSPGVSINNLNLNIDLPSIISWAVNGILNLFDGVISDKIDSAFAGVLQDKIPPLLQGFLQGINLSTGFSLPAPFNLSIDLDTGLGTVAFDTGGGAIGLDATLYTPNGVVNPEPVGGILQEQHQWPAFDTSKMFGIALSYDLLNQALYSIWYGGALNIDLTQFMNNNPPAMGMTGLTATLNGMAPPVLKPTSNGNYPFELQVGDLKLHLTVQNVPALGTVDLVAYASAFLDADVTIDQNNLIQLQVANNARISLEFDTPFDGFLDTGSLAMAIGPALQSFLPILVGQVLHGIPIPTINLSNLAGSYLPPGIVLGIQNGQTTYDTSYLLVEGNIEQQ